MSSLSIKDLSNTLGISERQVRTRLDKLDGVLDRHIKHGENQKILVDSGGLAILERLRAYEEQGEKLSDAVEKMRKELESEDVKPSQAEKTESRDQIIELLKQRIGDKEREIGRLERELERLHALIQNRLPPPKGNSWWQFWK